DVRERAVPVPLPVAGAPAALAADHDALVEAAEARVLAHGPHAGRQPVLELVAPEVHGEGLEAAKDPSHRAAQGVPARGTMIVDDHHLSTGPGDAHRLGERA